MNQLFPSSKSEETDETEDKHRDHTRLCEPLGLVGGQTEREKEERKRDCEKGEADSINRDFDRE